MRNSSGQQGAAGKVKMRGCEKKLKRTGAEATKFLVSTYDNSSIKTMCNGSVNSKNVHPHLGAFARHLVILFWKRCKCLYGGAGRSYKNPTVGLKNRVQMTHPGTAKKLYFSSK